MPMRNPEMENPAPGPRGASENDLLAGSVILQSKEMPSLTQDRRLYLLLELRCTALRVRLLVNEIDAIAVAFKAGFISAEAAIAYLWEIGAPLAIRNEASEEEAQ